MQGCAKVGKDAHLFLRQRIDTGGASSDAERVYERPEDWSTFTTPAGSVLMNIAFCDNLHGIHFHEVGVEYSPSAPELVGEVILVALLPDGSVEPQRQLGPAVRVVL